MGLFASEDERRLEVIFATSDLDNVVWREPMAAVAPKGATAVDVVVTVSDPVSISDTRVIGLGYWQSRLALKGVQSIREGESRVFKNVWVNRADDLFIAMDSDVPVSVDVVPAGTGKEKPKEESALNALASGFGQGAGKVLVLAAIIGALVLYAKGKVAAKIAGV